MRILRKLSICGLVAIFYGCVNRNSSDDVLHLAKRIQNSDIQWDGDYWGLKPSVKGPAKELLARRSEKRIPALIDALKNPKRFVAADVVLTEISGIKKQTTAISWNGLHVELLADGRVLIPEEQQPALIQQWSTLAA